MIIAGDLTASNHPKQWSRFFDWIQDQNYRKIVFISGNHDTWMEKNQKQWISKTQEKDIEYLCDSGCEFEGLKIWGTPWSLWFPYINPDCTAFTWDEENLKKKYELIPDDTDIIISHGPAYCILDKTKHGEHVGSFSLTSKLLIV